MKAMKKVLALIMAGALTLGMATTVMATEEKTHEDMATVTVTKTYTVENEGTTSPAETFSFSTLTCTGVTHAAVGVTAENAPVPTIASVSYAAGENGAKNITITLPEYTGVGIYTYTFSEVDNNTAGVTYHTTPITLVVTVIEQDGKVRVAAVHTEGSEEATKSDDFENIYSAGSLSVKKTVTGNMGDQTKEFAVKVTFVAPEGDTVREAINYNDGTAQTIAAGWTGTKEVTINVKHDETVTFTNIPYGVTYTVLEDNYTSEGYDEAEYSEFDGNINSAADNVEITNNKGMAVDTGIGLDSIPYITLLILVCGAAVLFVINRRRSMEF